MKYIQKSTQRQNLLIFLIELINCNFEMKLYFIAQSGLELTTCCLGPQSW